MAGKEALSAVAKLPLWAKIVGAILALLLVAAWIPGFRLQLPFALGKEDPTLSGQSQRRPAEFLYLDNGRVAAYLAQLEGGIQNSERLTNTLTTGAEAKVTAGNFLSAGGSSQVQSFVEREVTPTAAAVFFRLVDDLGAGDMISTVSVRSLEDIEDAGEAAFVKFSSNDLRTPVYANPYQVVRQAGTLPALFPLPSSSKVKREAVRQLREDSEGFARQVGLNPRLTFSIRPDEAPAEKQFTLLLPVRYQQLTDERSLIQNGGGEFTVVGKVIRVYPTEELATYVDTPTRETWTQPLRHAPGGLFLRTASKCEFPGGGKAEGSELRDCVQRVLMEQTKVDEPGAVILPMAIYK
jgi:hypothetical protein